MNIQNTDLGKRAQALLSATTWSELLKSQDRLVKHYKEIKAVMEGLSNIYHGNADDTTKAEVLEMLKGLTKLKKKSKKYQGMITKKFDPPKDDKLDPNFADLYESKTFDLKKFLIENKLTKNSRY